MNDTNIVASNSKNESIKKNILTGTIIRHIPGMYNRLSIFLFPSLTQSRVGAPNQHFQISSVGTINYHILGTDILNSFRKFVLCIRKTPAKNVGGKNNVLKQFAIYWVKKSQNRSIRSIIKLRIIIDIKV